MADQAKLPPDPIRANSLSVPIAATTALLLAATVWAIYDESVVKRPYLEMQDRWVAQFSDLIDRNANDARGREAAIKKTPEYLALAAEKAKVEAAQSPTLRELGAQLAAIGPYFDATSFTFRDKKGKIDEYVSRIEHVVGASKDDLRAELERFKSEKFKLDVPVGGGKFESKEYDANTLIAEFLGKKAEQGRLQGALGRANAPVQASRKAVDDYVAEKLGGLSFDQMERMQANLVSFRKEIKQIHVAEIDLVDRCESCHLGILQPMEIKPSNDMDRVFMSHPNKDLLALHDVEKFGCSLCHGGNGVGVISVEKAHGKYKHWLWPMHERENVQAGCVACHTNDIHLKHGGAFNQGREIFRDRGCWGCHRYEGHDTEADELANVRKDLMDLAAAARSVRRKQGEVEGRIVAVTQSARDADKRLEAELAAAEEDGEPIPDEVADARREALKTETAKAIARINVEKDGFAQALAALETSRAGKDGRQHQLWQEVKKVGPNLKEIRHKLKPEWLPTWIKNPELFRPDTKMPSFAHITDAQLKEISAFIWARALKTEGPAAVPLAKQTTGDADAGKRLFESRGCTACHSTGTGAERLGGDWAANLSRLGEKANFDYIVHWVQHPRSRLAPYSPDQGKDLTPADFAAAGKKFEWDEQDPRDPTTGSRMIGHQFTAMPSLRLDDGDARDIATYLLTLKTEQAYTAVDWMTNPTEETLKRGEMWTKHFGCTGCHEIAGLESEQRIGVELTVEGSKPMERLDFGTITHEAKYPKRDSNPSYDSERKPEVARKGWYNHQGFFMAKLKNPQIYDEGKERGHEDVAALKMPNFRLDYDDRVAVTTFLLGSVEHSLPKSYMHKPEGKGKAIQEGWWVVKKYNCQGCHSFEPGEVAALWTQPNFGGRTRPDWESPRGEIFRYGLDRRPPTLAGQGFRTDPAWLTAFLRNPALSTEKLHQNGVRPYLNVRMPSYGLSEGEIQKLVAFFNALADQPEPRVKPDIKPLNADELAAAREFFYSEESNCVKCHAKSEAFDPNVNAPNFGLTPARLNPHWVSRWMQDPKSFSPGTAMPELFKLDDKGHWRFTGQAAPLFKKYEGDQTELMQRFLYRYNEYAIAPEKN